MKISRRHVIYSSISLVMFHLMTACQTATADALLTVDNLQQLATQADAQHVPILLFVTAPYCHYCHQLEHDVIQPMLKNPHYDGKVLMRRLDLGQDNLIDFDGIAKDTLQIAKHYHAQLTPTIVFLAPNGQPIADNIVGVVADIDQYGGMIDARLNRALTALGNPEQIHH